MSRSVIRGRERKKLQVRGAQATGSEGVPCGTSKLHGAQATKQMDFLRSRLGFTLLELMISISMLVIIMVIISGAMRLASRSITAGERKVEALERLRTSLSIINAQIQSGTPLMYSDQSVQSTLSTQSTQAVQRAPAPGTRKSYFKGNRNSLQLSTNYSIWGGQKGYVIVSYRVETDLAGKRSLYASEHIVGIEASRETKLLEGFDDIGFDYFDKGLMAGEPGTWLQEWTSDTTTPSRVRLYLLSGSKERWMILPLRAKPLTNGVNG